MTTKIKALVDGLGNLVSFTLLPGQRHDIAGVEPLIKDREFDSLLADKAFDANWLLKNLMKKVLRQLYHQEVTGEYNESMIDICISGVTWLKTFSVT